MGWPDASSSIARLILFGFGGVACCATVVATPSARHTAMEGQSTVLPAFLMEVSPFRIGAMKCADDESARILYFGPESELVYSQLPLWLAMRAALALRSRDFQDPGRLCISESS